MINGNTLPEEVIVGAWVVLGITTGLITLVFVAVVVFSIVVVAMVMEDSAGAVLGDVLCAGDSVVMRVVIGADEVGEVASINVK